MSDYKAIIFDLDGTAIPNTPNGIPSQLLVVTIAKNKSKIILSAATGRPISNAKYIMDALGIDQPSVISAGTQIVNPKTGEILWEALIETDDVEKILAICRPYNYELLIREELIGQGSTATERTITDHVNVMYFMGCTDADAEIILENLSLIPTITAAGVASWTHEGVDIHITHKEATKEHAITELLRMLDIPKERAIGVGDANNDVHLFKAVGHKVAMGNATELLKSQADEICDSVDGDGLAGIITKYAA